VVSLSTVNLPVMLIGGRKLDLQNCEAASVVSDLR
jgi:hypothetical protein